MGDPRATTRGPALAVPARQGLVTEVPFWKASGVADQLRSGGGAGRATGANGKWAFWPPANACHLRGRTQSRLTLAAGEEMPSSHAAVHGTHQTSQCVVHGYDGEVGTSSIINPQWSGGVVGEASNVVGVADHPLAILLCRVLFFSCVPDLSKPSESGVDGPWLLFTARAILTKRQEV